MNRYVLLLLAATLSIGACATSRTAPEQAPDESAPDAPVAVTPVVTPVAADTFQAAPTDTIPLDPQVRIGRFENGLTYYIRRNTEPENRAELRLVVDAGAVLEEDDQLGLAHFLEHMLFNGTERFPEQKLIDFLERTGMRFGPDINAYTSFDETVYMLQIPMDSTEIVQMAFDVLEDWAAHATLSNAEIDKERGVVIEEWRMRTQNAQGRITEQILPVLLHDSRYKDRLPIGKPEILQNAPAETVRRFYRTWYRPDLMAVVAVGDFEVDRMEALIREHFAHLENPAEPRPRTSYDVPGHDETLFAVVTDPEYPYTTVQVAYKRAAEPFETVADYREQLIGQLFNGLLNKRFGEIARKPGAPFVGASAYKGGFVRTSEFYGLSAQVQDDSLEAGLAAILTEAARVRAHGFTETELDRQRQDVLRAYQRANEERENLPSESFAGEYVNHFLEDEPTPGIAYEYALVERLLPEITVGEVNRLAAELLAEENRAVLVTMPEKEGLTPPAEAELAAVFEAVEAQTIDPYVDEVSDAPLVTSVPAPASITAEQEIAELGVTEFTLANGVRVVLKPTDFKEDEVRFSAFSPGGSSLVSDADFFEAQTAAALVAQSGVGAFDRTALQKRLSGKVVEVAPYIGEVEEGLSGQASPADLETMFQLIHLYFTEPRADPAALATMQNQMRAYLTNRSATPAAAFQDTLTAALYGDHPRYQPLTMGMVDSLDLEDAHAIYRDRFADAGDFTFVFVGSFDPAEVKTLAQTYLGTLPAAGRAETWRDVEPEKPEGVVKKTVRKGVAPQSQVRIIFHGDFAYTRENRQHLRTLAEVLRIRLREDLREERGGVYGVSVQPGYDDRPDPEYQFVIGFTCAPERVDELVGAVFQNIDALRSQGPRADDLEKVKEQQRRERETALKTNAFWVGQLNFYYDHPEEPVQDILRYEDMVRGVSAEDVQEAAQQYLGPDRYVQAVLYPEKIAGE